LARTALTLTDSSLDGVAVTYDAVDAVNGNYFVNTGQEYIIVKNDSAASITATVVSVPCSHGRTDDSVITVAAGAQKVAGPFKKDLFNQSGTSNVNVDFSSATSVTTAVIKP
jgi:hypothetical protein